MKSIRSFIAVNLPEDIRTELGKAQNALKPEVSGSVSWVRTGNIHLTLTFLGNIPGDTVDRVHDCITNSIKGMGPFIIGLSGYGVFPNPRRPRVIWAGIDQGIGPLSEISDALGGALAGCGFKLEKRAFKPHVTIGRIKTLRRPEGLITRLKTLTSPEGAININTIDLMQSTLKPDGAQYTVLRACKLTGKGAF